MVRGWTLLTESGRRPLGLIYAESPRMLIVCLPRTLVARRLVLAAVPEQEWLIDIVPSHLMWRELGLLTLGPSEKADGCCWSWGQIGDDPTPLPLTGRTLRAGDSGGSS